MQSVGKPSVFRAFSSRNYLLFFCGQSLSLVGTWMQRTGVSWVIYTMTQSTFMLGLSVFASQFPSFIFSLAGGVLSDRYNRLTILMVTQIASLIQAAALAVLTLTGNASVPAILSLSVLLGIINAFDVPARQPLVHELIQNKEDVANAVALNSSMVNMARLIGPALSGLVLHYAGAGVCFLANAMSFIAVIISIAMMRLPQQAPSVEKKEGTFREGWTYVKATPSISMILFILMLLSLLVLPYDTLMPVFAKEVFKGDASTFGYISSFMGIGAVTGTLFLASLKKGTDLKIVLLINTIVLGIGLMIFSQISSFPLAMVFAVISGFGGMSLTTICLTILQVKTKAHMRGRVMSLLAMAFFGMLPVGSLLIGTVSQHIGAPDALLCAGALGIVIAAVFAKFLRSDRLSKKQARAFEEVENEVMNQL
jgi:MFS family permease